MAQDNLQPQTDQELEFKKRARRRLVGAIALVLLMIVVLPMILQDRTAQAPKQDVVVSIPSQDQGLSQSEAQSSEAQPSAAEVAPVPIQQAAPESSPVEQKTTEAPTPVASNDKPAEALKAEAPKQEPAKTEAKAPESKVSGSYFVQIGVFSDPDNVKQMQDKLSAKGLKTRAESIDTAKGQKTRLRVGPFADKKEAETALEKVKSLSLTGMIVSAS